MSRYYRYINGLDSFKDEKSFLFDGADEVVRINPEAVVDLTGGATISCWIKSSSMPTWSYLCSKGSGAGANSAFNYRFSSGFLYSNYLGSSVYTGINGLDDDSWHHLVITHDYSTGDVKFYKDSVVSATVLTYANAYANADLECIGALTITGSSAFNGNINEFAVIPGVLNQSQIDDIYNSGKPTDLSELNPMHWYRAEKSTWDGSKFTITDQGSEGDNAESVNMEEVDVVNDVP